MVNTLVWKNSFWGNCTKVFTNGNTQVGELKTSFWGNQTRGALGGKQYLFRKRSVWSNSVDIIDERANVLKGRITFSSWGSRADIEFKKAKGVWKYANCWYNKWVIRGSDNTKMVSTGLMLGGEIKYDHENELWALTGLYIDQSRKSDLWIVMFVIIIPVMLPAIL